MTADYHLDHRHYSGPCPMLMVFHGGNCEQILWHGWTVSDIVEFIFATLAIFVLAFSYEALKFFNQQLLKKNSAKEMRDAKVSTAVKSSYSETPLTGRYRNGYRHEISTTAHFIHTLLHTVQVMISYLLMMVFMNFNYWLCLAVISGLSLGFFGFGWLRRINFVTECCN
ncbi:high affinity copper uptake protein 1-like [Anastrepha obliqua]|uniref:high affinity copper uptake protein 1-like n=1 Tax=Anastrepha obliqua TaxID=95512 RepID=UPI00240A10E0|nr:high affinity copper uptake protein 1-like [Anastrepha obliqua]